MSEIGTERVEPMAQVVERMGDEDPRERGPRSRRQPPATVPPGPNPEPADHSETPPHQVDSLA
jgi:hypothetical protein